jgi:hypothetical protein
MRWAYVDSQPRPSQTLTPVSQATKGYELVVRSISTVGNYDYLVCGTHTFPWSPVLTILICQFDYTFSLDGTLEIRCETFSAVI